MLAEERKPKFTEFVTSKKYLERKRASIIQSISNIIASAIVGLGETDKLYCSIVNALLREALKDKIDEQLEQTGLGVQTFFIALYCRGLFASNKKRYGKKIRNRGGSIGPLPGDSYFKQQEIITSSTAVTFGMCRQRKIAKRNAWNVGEQ